MSKLAVAGDKNAADIAEEEEEDYSWKKIHRNYLSAFLSHKSTYQANIDAASICRNLNTKDIVNDEVIINIGDTKRSREEGNHHGTILAPYESRQRIQDEITENDEQIFTLIEQNSEPLLVTYKTPEEAIKNFKPIPNFDGLIIISAALAPQSPSKEGPFIYDLSHESENVNSDINGATQSSDEYIPKRKRQRIKEQKNNDWITNSKDDQEKAENYSNSTIDFGNGDEFTVIESASPDIILAQKNASIIDVDVVPTVENISQQSQSIRNTVDMVDCAKIPMKDFQNNWKCSHCSLLPYKLRAPYSEGNNIDVVNIEIHKKFCRAGIPSLWLAKEHFNNAAKAFPSLSSTCLTNLYFVGLVKSFTDDTMLSYLFTQGLRNEVDRSYVPTKGPPIVNPGTSWNQRYPPKTLDQDRYKVAVAAMTVFAFMEGMERSTDLLENADFKNLILCISPNFYFPDKAIFDTLLSILNKDFAS